MKEPPKLLPYDDARELLGGIGKSMFFDLIRDGRLDKVKLGSRGFITRESVDRLIVSLTEEAVRGKQQETNPEGNTQQ